MSKTLRSSIGLILLITTVSLASCQSMINVISVDKNDVSIAKERARNNFDN